MVTHTYSKNMDQRGKVANAARGQLNREKLYFLSAFAPENLVSRDVFVNPVLRQPAHFYTQADTGTYLRDSPNICDGVHLFFLNRYTPSGQSRVYRVTQLRIDGVHCRESAGTGPVNLKVVSNECCCLGRPPWTN